MYYYLFIYLFWLQFIKVGEISLPDTQITVLLMIADYYLIRY